MKTSRDLVRACFTAYEKKDRSSLESVLADDFTFSSPIDNRIDRETYFKRCWPNSEHLKSFDLEKIAEDGNSVFVTYLATNANGGQTRNTEVFTIRDQKISAVHVYFGNSSAGSAHQDELKAMIDIWRQALCRKDTAAVLEHLAPDSTGFYLAPPLRVTGQSAEELQGWFDTFIGEINYELHELKIHVSGEVAFSESLNRLRGKKTDGTPVDLWFRLSMGFHKTPERWLIVHEHESVPFYMDGSFRAAIDLKP